jgi:HEPN domain-containing protein
MVREPTKKLALDYFHRATGRMEVVTLLISKSMHADAVRESQELVELALKGLLRWVGIDPPKIHDVGNVLIQYQSLFPQLSPEEISKLVQISKALRKEREISFYGDEELLPSENYTNIESNKALIEVTIVMNLVKKVYP